MALIFVAAGGAQAADRPAQADPALTELDCSLLRDQPSAPISVEACEAMKASQAALAEAAATPGGARPGDDALGCDALAAEMRTLDVQGVSRATADESQRAGEALQATLDRRTADAATMAARQAAGTAAASAGPNALQGAVAAKHTAEQAVLAREASREMQGVAGRATLANAASAMELAASLQANPRFARLMQLMVARNCDTDDPPR